MSLQHAANYLASHGRGPDDTLVHMTRREVQSLQDIARAHGGSLSINPDTGLVEAGFLKNLLPMIAGAALTATTGIPAWAIGLGVGGAKAVSSGSLEKGLMAGMGAYGGAGLMGGLTGSAATTVSEGAQSAAAAGDPTAGMNAMSGLDKVKYGIQGLGTEAGRSAALNAMGGGFGAAKTAGMALAPALTDTGSQNAPASDNEQYQYKYDPGRVEDPNAGYTGAFTGERTYFKPSFTRLPNIRLNEGGIAHFDDGGPTDDPNKTSGLQAAAQAQGVQVPFAQQAIAAKPAGSIQPVASNPYYTMTGASGDAYKYLMGLAPSSAAANPVVATKPNITADNTSSIDTGIGNKVVDAGGIDRVTTPAILPPDTSTPSIYTKPIVSDIPDEVVKPEDIPLIDAPNIIETIPSIYTKPIVSDIPDEVVKPEDIPVIDAPDILETIPSIYTKPIVSDIPDEVVDPYAIPTITPSTPLGLPDIPTPPEKKDVSYFDDVNSPDPYGPNRGGAGDLPEEFDKYLSPETPMPTSKSVDFYGGGKYFDDQSAATMAFATGGIADAGYSLGGYSDGGRLLRGPGDGISDSIPATIGAKKQPARLADGEFVVPARIVSELGNGSTEAGARKLYAMMDRIQAARGKTVGKGRVAANSRADRHLPV